MKIDSRLGELPLTPEQHFFAACWHNMVHAYSLDSYRVRAMNPENGLRELQRMLVPPANADDLAVVATELAGLLRTDPLLQDPPFAEATAELLDLLPANKEAAKQLDAKKPLILAFSRELLRDVRAEYVGASLDALERMLITDAGAGPTKQRLGRIHAFTGNLLSTLLDRGASIESLYQLYRQVICGVKPEKPYAFAKKFSLLTKLITQAPRKFRVIFVVDNVSNPGTFPSHIGPVTFSAEPPSLAAAPKPPVARYLGAQSKRLFAQVEVETSDYRTAGTEAYSAINNVLDLVRFEYERGRLQLPDEFVITDSGSTANYRIFPIPKVVPNPVALIDNDGLHGFIKSVNELMINPGFQEDGRSRVQSAFRLYRTGADAHVFENKLISWWTAIEYLVKGSNSSSGIGKAVEEALVPVLCLGYIRKLLLSFRSALVAEKVQLEDPHGKPLQLKELSPQDLLSLFRAPEQRQALLQSAKDPFLNYKLEVFLDALNQPEKTAALLKNHEQRLRWHVQRIYRARCDIVHSAERIVNAALLCANLEFYLKTTLTALLQALRTIPHMSGPKEFFDRQVHTYAKLIADLSGGNDKRLLIQLQK